MREIIVLLRYRKYLQTNNISTVIYASYQIISHSEILAWRHNS